MRSDKNSDGKLSETNIQWWNVIVEIEKQMLGCSRIARYEQRKHCEYVHNILDGIVM